MVCDGCGKKGHLAKFCKESCKECKEKSCPGVRGERCVVHNRKPLTVLKGAGGRDVPSFVLRILQEAQARWLKQGSSKVHAAEVDFYAYDQWGEEEEQDPEVSVAQEGGRQPDPEVAATAQRDVLERVLLGEATAAMARAGDAQ